MDKPTTPAGPNPTPQPEDSGSEQEFGATGVFGVVKAPEPVKRPEPAWGAAPDDPANRVTEAPKPPPAPPPVQPPNAPSEPVVHKVVFGGGAAASSPELLDRMRMASAERAPVQQSAPAAEPAAPKAPASPDPLAGGWGSGGFTQLLRTLEIDLPSPAGPPAVAPVPAARPPLNEKGLTGLLQAMGTPAQVEASMQRIQPAAPSIPAEPTKPPAAPAPGGFTQLLQTMPPADAEFGGAQTQAPGAGQAPVDDWAAKSSPAPAGNKPGTFTQLFGTLETADAPPPAPPERATGAPSGSGPGSFTRMLSLEQQSAPAAPPFAAAPYYEERKPSPGSLDNGLTPQTPGPAASRDPFAPAPLPESNPLQSTPAAGGVGITRLIRMLDEPGTPPPLIEAAPVTAPRSAEPGIWTQTFASLAEPEKPVAPVARVPEWTLPPAPIPAVAREPIPPFSAPAAAPSPASTSAGPSEFTRILDASRIRELAMQGGQAPSVPSPPQAPPPQSFAPPPPVPIPSYPPPAPPTVGGMPGYGAVSQPGRFPPPQPPAMYAPAPPAIPAPAPPAPAGPGTGKTQQYLLLMGGVIIVLLVAILVTVIFVMKH